MNWPLAPERFLDAPAAWADPALAANTLSPGLLANTASLLLHDHRFAPRATAILADRLGRGDLATLAESDRGLVLAGPAALSQAASLAGAVWHGARVRALVLAGDLAALQARHGAQARSSAMQHRTLSPATAGTGNLLDDIAEDGVRCVCDWIALLPKWAGARVRLVWAPRTGAAEPARGAAIVCAVAPSVVHAS